MLLTAEEAGDYSCCGPDGCGSTIEATGFRFCTGDGCMAWRWWDPVVPPLMSLWSKSRDEMVKPGEFIAEDDAEWRLSSGEKVPARRGYCGLAGKPEHA